MLSKKSLIYLIKNCRFLTDVRVRFAPSPTGDLHLGGLRTAFYNYLFAKKYKGTFILRIEDTDLSRCQDGSGQKIERLLTWTGMIPDESPEQNGPYGPYIQSERRFMYEKYAQELLKSKSAYKCFCTEKRLLLLKKEATRARRSNKYDRRCLSLSKQEIDDKLGNNVPYTIRFKLRPFKEGFKDLVYGDINHDPFEIEGDPIIIKADGFPTYHFANVIDDHEMKISHVLRGVEWQVSTPKHILLYEALNWSPPLYAHLPLLLNHDGTKLSKRQNNIHVQHYKNSGYFPDVLLNFLASVGGGFSLSRGSEITNIWTVNELFSTFDLSALSTYSVKMDMERLESLNRIKIKQCLENKESSRELCQMAKTILGLEITDDNLFLEYLKWSCDRIHTLNDLKKENLSFLWKKKVDLSSLSLQSAHVLIDVKSLLSSQNWSSDNFSEELRSYCKSNHISFSHLMTNLRIILCGVKEGPPIGEMVAILGRDSVIDRLNSAITHLNKS